MRHPRPTTAAFVLLVVAALAGCFVPPCARAQAVRSRTIGPGTCSSGPCHDNALQWWQSDAHFGTAQPFIEQAAKHKTMAARLNLSLDDAVTINRRCMGCHGTILTGAEGKLVEEGVSCESCHGPAGSWKDPHQDKVVSYAKLESTGMLRVDQPAMRAKVCVDCHYVVDQELLRAGHPYGWGKEELTKYTTGVERRIGDRRHWNKKVPTGADRDPAPFLQQVTAKGDVPYFPPLEGLPTAAAAGGERIVYVERDCGNGGGRGSIFFPSGEEVEVSLPDFTVSLNPDSLSNSLTLLQDRLEALYRLLWESR